MYVRKVIIVSARPLRYVRRALDTLFFSIVFITSSYFGVGGLRERDYQLAAQKRNEACRKFDNNCRTAKYFERESSLAQHFNSWSSRDNYCGDKLYDSKSKAERLRVRKNKLIKLLRDEEAADRIEMNRSESSRGHKHEQNEHQDSVQKLKKKLESKRAERSLYYPNNYQCYRSFNDVFDSIANYPRHYEKERHIDACRNSEVSMEDTNLRNYSSDCQGRKENPQNRHHGEKRHLQGHTMYGTNIDCFGEFSDQPVKHTGERRHYEAAVDNVDKGSNYGGDDDNASIMTTGTHFRDEKFYHDRIADSAGHAIASERRHYGHCSADHFGGLTYPNERQPAFKNPGVEESENAAEAEEKQVEAELQERDRAVEEDAAEANEVWEQNYAADHGAVEEPQPSSPESEDFNNKKNWSTDDINFSWKYDDPSKRPVCFSTHQELVHQIKDLVSREIQARHKQNWSEALRLRDMRNRLELQREIEIFHHNDLNLKHDKRRSELLNISHRIKLMDKREIGQAHLVYSEEARNLWESRVREDDKILSKDDRAKREILLKELEEEWEAMTLKDKEYVAKSPEKSYLQEEFERNSAAMEHIEQNPDYPNYHASNEDSKNSCTRNKYKGASSLIFLG